MDMDPQSEPFQSTASILRTTYSKLVRSGQYITGQDFSKFNIACSDLEIQSGNFSDCGPRFLSLYPRATIHEILNETQPWLHRAFPEEQDCPGLYAAVQISSLLHAFLAWSRDADPAVEPLIERTKWQSRFMNADNSEHLYSVLSGREFRGQFIMDMLDYSVPHISCFLAGDTPLEADSLLRSEIYCIIALTKGRINLASYRIHPIIPVTLISASSWQVRVVQAYIDHKTGTIQARKSSIIDMAEEVSEKTELLLSWLLADPIEVGSSKQNLVTEVQAQDYLQSGKAKKHV